MDRGNIISMKKPQAPGLRFNILGSWMGCFQGVWPTGKFKKQRTKKD